MRALVAALVVLVCAGLVPARAEDARLAAVDAIPMGPSPEERLDEIRRRIQAAVVYPPRARELGWHGTSRIQFRVGNDGLAREISTVASSGHALLDAAAQRGARDAGQLPALYGWIRIPIVFDLAQAGPGTRP